MIKMLLGRLGIAILKAAILAAIEAIGRRQIAFSVGVQREDKTGEEGGKGGTPGSGVAKKGYPKLRFDFELRSLPPERRYWLSHPNGGSEIHTEEIIFGDEESTQGNRIKGTEDKQDTYPGSCNVA